MADRFVFWFFFIHFVELSLSCYTFGFLYNTISYQYTV
jgi:hypothetical protein